jgi:DNA-binding response OmpR family regulator
MNITELDSSAGEDILIVDDTKANLQLLSDILSDAGYKVRSASDGELAMRSVKAKLPDLILLDIKLPGMDGLEVCRQLKAKERTCSIPVIFISVLEGKRSKIQGFQAGAVDYINKPFYSEEVLARVKTHLSINQLQLELKSQNSQLLKEITERKLAQEQRDKLIAELQKALSEVKTLRGFLPICSYCKKIRDDKGYWSQIESYIHKHSDAEFSHGICPECAKKYFPDMDLHEGAQTAHRGKTSS